MNRAWMWVAAVVLFALGGDLISQISLSSKSEEIKDETEELVRQVMADKSIGKRVFVSFCSA